VTIQLTGTDAFGNQVTRSTQSDPLGQYSFAGLTRGTYTMTEIQPLGYEQGTNTLGSLGGTLSGDSVTVDVGCGQNGVMYHFGEVAPVPVIPPPPIVVPPPQPITPLPSKFFFIGRSWLDLI
jgi:hypothetical protein